MKKQLATAVFATLALGAVAFAANPFSDVPANHWAYQSVSELADAGIIDGYPDGTFQGAHNITRYEMAQMTAKAMARADKADAQQRAVINQLADEFSSELNSLGVRVENLEKKVGNVKTTGDFRVRYQDGIRAKDNKDNKVKNNADRFDMRAQLKFNAQVAEGTKAAVKLRTGNMEFGDADAVKVDLYEAYLAQDLGKHAVVTAGRYNQTLGVTGAWYDDHVDGASLKVENNSLFLEGGYAHLLSMDVAEKGDLKAEAGFAQAGFKVGDSVKVQGLYMDLNGKVGKSKIDNVWGAGVGFYGKDFAVTGDYVNTSFEDDKKDDAEFFYGKVQLGKADLKEAGTVDLWVDYTDADQGSYFGGTGLVRSEDFLNDAKGWGVGADYVLAKGLKLTAYQTFNTKFKSNDSEPDSEYTRVQVSYNF